MSKRARSACVTLATILGAGCLAITLLAAGFAACLLPPTARILSEQTSAFELTPYAPEQLVELAQETREFTVDDYGRSRVGDEGAETLLKEKIVSAAQASSHSTSPTANRWPSEAVQALDENSSATSAACAADALAAVGDSFALDADALSHLQDCNDLISFLKPLLTLCAAVTLLAIIALFALRRRHACCTPPLYRICIGAPIALIACIGILGAWALADFNGFFAAFHAVFFPQGNWTFSYDSLLICMYPLDFWVGMATVWAAVSGGACIICLLFGLIIRRKVLHDQ